MVDTEGPPNVPLNAMTTTLVDVRVTSALFGIESVEPFLDPAGKDVISSFPPGPLSALRGPGPTTPYLRHKMLLDWISLSPSNGHRFSEQLRTLVETYGCRPIVTAYADLFHGDQLRRTAAQRRAALVALYLLQSGRRRKGKGGRRGAGGSSAEDEVSTHDPDLDLESFQFHACSSAELEELMQEQGPAPGRRAASASGSTVTDVSAGSSILRRWTTWRAADEKPFPLLGFEAWPDDVVREVRQTSGPREVQRLRRIGRHYDMHREGLIRYR
eukprot:g16625.t1